MKPLNEFIEKFTEEKPENVVKKGREYYIVPPELQKIADGIDRNCFSIGIPLGEFKKNFKPSLSLLDWISKRTEKKVFINKKTEWLFLCGRDVFTENIIKINVKKGKVLVQNEKDENIGLGTLNDSGVRHIMDRGDFLRREK